MSREELNRGALYLAVPITSSRVDERRRYPNTLPHLLRVNVDGEPGAQRKVHAGFAHSKLPTSASRFSLQAARAEITPQSLMGHEADDRRLQLVGQNGVNDAPTFASMAR